MTTSPAAYADVVARIARAAQAAGRLGSDVTLVAVSKTQPWEAVAPVLAAGQAVFGTQWRDVVAFVLLVLVLLIRPTGILGESLGKARA